MVLRLSGLVNLYGVAIRSVIILEMAYRRCGQFLRRKRSDLEDFFQHLKFYFKIGSSTRFMGLRHGPCNFNEGGLMAKRRNLRLILRYVLYNIPLQGCKLCQYRRQALDLFL